MFNTMYILTFLFILTQLIGHCHGNDGMMRIYVKIAPSWKNQSELMAQFEGKGLPLAGGNFNMLIYNQEYTDELRRLQYTNLPVAYPKWVQVIILKNLNPFN